MEYEVQLTDAAQNDFTDILAWYHQQAPLQTKLWHLNLMSTLESLKSFPHRCSKAPESIYFERPVYQIFYGRHHGVYRVLFNIHGKQVDVLHIRHGARRRIAEDEL